MCRPELVWLIYVRAQRTDQLLPASGARCQNLLELSFTVLGRSMFVIEKLDLQTQGKMVPLYQDPRSQPCHQHSQPCGLDSEGGEGRWDLQSEPNVSARELVLGSCCTLLAGQGNGRGTDGRRSPNATSQASRPWDRRGGSRSASLLTPPCLRFPTWAPPPITGSFSAGVQVSESCREQGP